MTPGVKKLGRLFRVVTGIGLPLAPLRRDMPEASAMAAATARLTAVATSLEENLTRRNGLYEAAARLGPDAGETR